VSLPNLVIAGAPKSGTTSLFKWLQAHPSVVTSRIKETYYLMDPEYCMFNKDSNYLTGGLEGYSKLFPKYQSGQFCIEATPDNMYQKTALKVLSELPTQPTIVFILRDPVQRVLSMFEFAKNTLGTIDLNVSARDFFERIKNGQFSDDQILNNALLYSEYHTWIDAWIKSCGESRVEIFFFEEIVEAPRSLVNKICNRIGIDGAFYNDFEFKPENPSLPVRSGKLVQIKKLIGRAMPTLSKSSFPQFIYKAINVRHKGVKSTYDSALLNEMYEYFAEPNQKLASILGRELPIGWTRYQSVSIGSGKKEGGLRLKGVKKETQPGRPLITIITATYNSSKWLPHEIKSIREQSYDNIEWIVIDGASTDRTVDILKENEDIVDYWLSEPDTGIYDAWNKGIDAAKGEWICFLGSDDYFAENGVLSEMVAVSDADVDLISGRSILVDASGKVVRLRGGPWDWNRHKFYQQVAHPGMLHRKTLFDKFGKFNPSYRIAGDYEFLLRIGTQPKAYFLNKNLVCIGNEGVSHTELAVVFGETRLIQKLHRQVGVAHANLNYAIAWTKIIIKKLLCVH
jgi:hypothetical protein